MRRNTLALLTLSVAVLAACRPAEVVVTLEVEQVDPTQEGGTQVTPLADVEVQLIPFDRDVVFDSLAAAAATPEPEIPPDLLEAREEIQAAQREWQNLETRWNVLRDTMTKINEELQRYSQGEPTYIALYDEWQEFDAEYQRVDRQVKQAFAEFRELQEAALEQTREVEIARENWAADAFADAPAVFATRLSELRREIHYDTTNAQGIARVAIRKEGEWWVHARWEGAFTELYWNIPVTVPAGETVPVRLDRSNAEERPKL